MHVEYEVRILDIDCDSFIKKLENIGAKFQRDHIQKRYVYDFKPAQAKKWIRLRTNGDKTTLTIKNVISSEIDGTEELEIVVDDFEKSNLILGELGYQSTSYQENRRIRYDLNGVEVDIDFWPMIPTYVEIEGNSENAVYEVLELLGYSKSDATSLDVESIYLKYGINLKEIHELKLEEERK